MIEGKLDERVRRLEVLFTALLIATGDEGDDDEFWFELRHLLRRRERPSFRDMELDMFFDRLMHRRRQAQPASLLRRVESVASELDSLKSRTETLQKETHTFLALQALSLPSDQVRSPRFVPIRVYVDSTPEGAVRKLSSAIGDVLSAYGFEVADEFPSIEGSWFKKWFAKSKDSLSQPEVIERLKKIERAVELMRIDGPQADVDEKQANAIANLIDSLDGVPNAALQAGSVLVVKLTTPNGPVIQARTLTQKELIELENNQLLLQDPASVLGKLSAACASTRSLSSASPKGEARG